MERKGGKSSQFGGSYFEYKGNHRKGHRALLGASKGEEGRKHRMTGKFSDTGG